MTWVIPGSGGGGGSSLSDAGFLRRYQYLKEPGPRFFNPLMYYDTSGPGPDLASSSFCDQGTTATAFGTPSRVAGQFGNAISVAGGDGFTVDDNEGFFLSPGRNWTMSFWVKCITPGVNGIVIADRTNGWVAKARNFGITSSGDVRYSEFGLPQIIIIPAASNIDDNAWHHIAIVFIEYIDDWDVTTNRIIGYFDGVQVSNNNFNANLADLTHTSRIMYNVSTGSTGPALFEEFGYMQYALHHNTIAAIAAGEVLSEGGLIIPA